MGKSNKTIILCPKSNSRANSQNLLNINELWYRHATNPFYNLPLTASNNINWLDNRPKYQITKRWKRQLSKFFAGFTNFDKKINKPPYELICEATPGPRKQKYLLQLVERSDSGVTNTKTPSEISWAKRLSVHFRWCFYILVGLVGLEPTRFMVGRFWVCCVCHSATTPDVA